MDNIVENRELRDVGVSANGRSASEEALIRIWAEVLRLPDIAVDANFFDIGGDSMNAMEVIMRVGEVIGVDLPLMAFFQDPTVAHLAVVVDELKGGDTVAPIERVPGRREFPLSSSQQVFWLLAQQNRGTGLYVTARIFRVQGKADSGILERSLNELRRRHEILRVRFISGPEGPLQIVGSEHSLHLKVSDLSALDPEVRDLAAAEVALLTVREPFDLETGPMLRAQLVQLTAEDSLLCVAIHHVVSDGFTGSIFLEELAVIYDAFADGQPDPLPPVELHFTDFAAWEREWMKGERLERELDYWREVLRNVPQSIDLPTDFDRPAAADRGGRLITVTLPLEPLRQLQSLAQSNGATLFTILSAGLRILLHRWSGQEDFSIGTIASNRSRANTERMIGCFVNPLPLRNTITASERAVDLIEREKTAVMEAFAHQDCPFARIVDALSPQRSGAVNPFFNVALLLQNFPAIAVTGRHFRAHDINFDAQTALIDLRIIATVTDSGLRIDCEYSTELFTAATATDLLATYTAVLTQLGTSPESTVADFELSARLANMREQHQRRKHKQTIAIAANFTAEPIEEALAFWMEQLHLPSRIDFGPFDQVFQQLLDPASLLATNSDGVNLIFLRWRESQEKTAQAREFAAALKSRATGGGTPIIICICPPAALEEEQVLAAELSGYPGVHVIYPGEILDLYPVENYLDHYAEDAGAIPYTPDFFAALASIVARKIYSLKSSPYKVIALDCDNTLWRGVCGEDGPLGVKVDLPYRELQQNMLTQRDAGMILTLVSKNVEEDVDAVFAQNSGMLLRRSDIVTSRVNWQSKSENLKDMARALRLDLSSFILIDDNPLECAQVRADCPEVLVLELPPDSAAIPRVLRHFWAFDHQTVTREDSLRTPQYQQEQAREQTRTSSGNLADFLRSLELRIDVREMHQDDRPRVSQLTQRTNQFNCTTVRLSDSEVQSLIAAGDECLVISVSDRFGDYGLVGVAIFSTQADALSVHTFLMSCRALGRRVEHHILAHLGSIASERNLDRVDIDFRPTAKNRPAQDFLDSLGAQFRDGAVYRIPRAYAVLAPELAVTASPDPSAGAPATSVWPGARADLEYIAKALADIPAITRAIALRPRNTAIETDLLKARNATEEIISGIWATLLRVPVPGVRDDFFRLGGNSLLAVQVLSRVRQSIGVELPLRALFEAPTLGAFAARITAAGEAGTLRVRLPLVKVSRKDSVPASFAQQRLWFIDQLEPGNPINNIPQMMRMQGRLNVSALQDALSEIVRRHEALRTAFEAIDGHPIQIIQPAVQVPLPVIDLSHEPERVDRLAQEHATWPFDLANGLLLRALLLRTGADEHILLIVFHHISGDRWSAGILAEELQALYAAFAQQRPSPLPELPVQYADFSQWQRSWLQGAELETQALYWQKQLAGAPAVIELPTDRPRPPVLTHKGAIETAYLPLEMMERLTELSQSESVTLFMTMLAAFQVLMGRYSRQDDIVVGSPIAGRNTAEVEPLIGFFVNTLALRTDLSGDPTFSELLGRVRKVALDAYAHQDIPFERLVEELQPERSLSYEPIFQVMFALQNAPQQSLELDGLHIHRLPLHQGTSAFDMSWFATHVDSGMQIRVEYSTDLFDAVTIQRAITHFTVLLEAVTANPSQRIGLLPILTGDEAHAIELASRGPVVEYPRERALHAFFEDQVAARPSAPAIVFESISLTYAELNGRANQLAHRLRALGVGPDVLVGICAERSVEMVVGLLGVLKAGGAYVPLDPEYPRDRLALMLADSEPAVLLTTEALLNSLPSNTIPTLCLDRDWPSIATEPTSNPAILTTGKNVAYVIYTSGSTGIPKGVPNVHQGIVNRLLWMQNTYNLGPSDRVLQKTPYSFDVSVWEFFWPLVTGATLVVAKPEGHKDPDYLIRLIKSEQITTSHFVPSMLRIFLEADDASSCTSLRRVLCSGEALTYAIQEAFFATLPAELHNLYGPTEAAVDVTYWQCVPNSGHTGVPIGRPVWNTQIRILSPSLQPVPFGLPGELHIGGVQLARGYLKRPELTAEKFIRDPFSDAANARLYKTGDLARLMEDGTVEYLGRIDHQVKLRGFRIELGEIESALRNHPAITDCVVIVSEASSGDKRLVAYFVATSTPAIEDLRTHLLTTLPEYMVPAVFVKLEALPLSANGKLDRKALPAPDDALSRTEYIAPGNATERAVADIWSEVLNISPISMGDNFFSLGGHSLRATQVVSRIRKALRVELPLRAVFEAPTVEGLAKRVAESSGSLGPAMIPRVPRDQPLPLSFAQERLWFLNQFEPGNPQYNIPRIARLHGILDTDALQRSLNEVARRHEVLRTTFTMQGDRPVQVISSSHELPVAIIDLSGLPEAERASEWRRICEEESERPFDLASGPLLRALLLRLGADDHVFMVNLHHITTERWSLGLLWTELGTLYRAYTLGQPSPLEELPVQYADYAVWQRDWLQGAELEKQVSYWRERLAGCPRLELPTDHPRPAVSRHRGDTMSRELPAVLIGQLAAFSQTQSATLYMTMLAAFKALLVRYTGQEDIVIGVTIAGRVRTEIETLIGFFVNSLVLRTNASGDPSFNEFVARIKETSLGAYSHQDIPFEKLVSELNPERTLNRNPFFQVAFVHDQSIRGLELPGLEVDGSLLHQGTSVFDLTWYVVEHPDGVRIFIEYDVDLFESRTIAKMLDHYLILLTAAIEAPQTTIAHLPLLSEQEQKQMLLRSRRQVTPSRVQQLTHAMFAEQVRKTPEATALQDHVGRTMSYAELDVASNQVAAKLLKSGAVADTLIGICLERSVTMVVAILGVLKAGAAYLPLDASYPEERLRFIVKDAGPKILLTDGKLDFFRPMSGITVYDIVNQWDDFSVEPVAAVPTVATATDLAYVIYTSGSTGQPKGAMITHAGLANYLAWAIDEYRVHEGSGAPVSSAIGFDATVTSLWTPLLTGRKVVLLADDNVLEGLTTAIMTGERFSLLKITPAHLEALSRLIPPDRCAGIANALVVGGEALSLAAVQFWRENAPEIRIINEYGPTETVVGCCTFEIPANFKSTTLTGSVPIGRPIANTDLYVLDRNRQLVPDGVAGELYIGGAGLCRGYLNRPELTAERFVPDQFRPGSKVYRTGDLCRWMSDGNLEYIGRLDHQVKIRGYRIELGEIEAALRDEACVQECVVIAREDEPGDKRLVAYVVARGDEMPDPVAMRLQLGRTLPDYMVPAAIVLLLQLPLSPNGKIDRKALPTPDYASPVQTGGRLPETAVEEMVASIWSQILRIDRIFLADDFFGLGGHSLLATQVLSRIRTSLRIELPLRAIFEHSTLGAFAAQVAKARPGVMPLRPAITPASRAQALPPSFAQQRMWFIQQLDPGSGTYNMPSAMELIGNLDVGALEFALNEIVARHEPLRTVFAVHDDEPVQVILPHCWFHLQVEDVESLDGGDNLEPAKLIAAAEAALPFDLGKGPMFRSRLLRLSNHRHVLVLVLHHINTDGWSRGVLTRELSELYTAKVESREALLPALTIQYADFAVWQRQFLSGANLSAQLEFWRRALAGAPDVLTLPADHKRSVETDAQPWASFHVENLSREVSANVTAFARRHTATPFMVLGSAFYWLLAKLSGQMDLVIGTDVANRTTTETERLIGFFINVLPMRARIAPSCTFTEFVNENRELLLDVFANQDMPFDKLVQELRPERSQSHNPLVQVLFVMENAAGSRLQLPGIEVNNLPSQFNARFDLSLFITPGEDMRAMWMYNTALFEPDTISRFGLLYRRLLTYVLSEPQTTFDQARIYLEGEEYAEMESAQRTLKQQSVDRLRNTRRRATRP